jgi:hypothetical protein
MVAVSRKFRLGSIDRLFTIIILFWIEPLDERKNLEGYATTAYKIEIFARKS